MPNNVDNNNNNNACIYIAPFPEMNQIKGALQNTKLTKKKDRNSSTTTKYFIVVQVSLRGKKNSS